jgi:hypothetical protein
MENMQFMQFMQFDTAAIDATRARDSDCDCDNVDGRAGAGAGTPVRVVSDAERKARSAERVAAAKLLVDAVVRSKISARGILASLPDELLAAFATFLTPENRAAARQVCRSWRGGIARAPEHLRASALTTHQFRWASEFGALPTLRLSRRAARAGDDAILRAAFKCSGLLPWDRECTRVAVMGGYLALLQCVAKTVITAPDGRRLRPDGFHPDHIARCAIGVNNAKILTWAYLRLRADLTADSVLCQLGRTADPGMMRLYLGLAATGREAALERMKAGCATEAGAAFNVYALIDGKRTASAELIDLVYAVIVSEGTKIERLRPAVRTTLEWMLRVYPPSRAACDALCPLLAELNEPKLLHIILEHGIEFDRTAVACKAAAYGSADVIRWLHRNCRGALSANLFIAADSVEMMQLLRELGCPWAESALEFALQEDRIEIVDWLVASGCPQSVYATALLLARDLAE